MGTEVRHNYLHAAITDFQAASREGLPALLQWCRRYWQISAGAVAFVTFLVLASLSANRPDPERIKGRFNQRLGASKEWTDIRWLQAEPTRDGGTYLALATYRKQYRCRLQEAGGAVTLHFYRPGGVRDNGDEVSRPVTWYEVRNGAIHTQPGNDDILREGARQALDALVFAKQ